MIDFLQSKWPQNFEEIINSFIYSLYKLYSYIAFDQFIYYIHVILFVFTGLSWHSLDSHAISKISKILTRFLGFRRFSSDFQPGNPPFSLWNKSKGKQQNQIPWIQVDSIKVTWSLVKWFPIFLKSIIKFDTPIFLFVSCVPLDKIFISLDYDTSIHYLFLFSYSTFFISRLESQ